MTGPGEVRSAVTGGRRRYHHIGIPTSRVREGETYLPELRMYVSGFDSSEFGVEWMRFEPDCPLPELVQTVAHVAFQVDDLERALEGREILIAPNSPSTGIRVAFVVEDGAPIEFLEIQAPATESRSGLQGNLLWPGCRGARDDQN